MNDRPRGASAPYFTLERAVAYRGPAFRPSAAEPLAYRCYDKDRLVLGKRMEDHLRFAVCYWHSLRLAGRRSVRRRDLPAPVACAPAAIRWSRRARRPTSPSSCSACSTCRSSPSTIATSRPRARRCANRTATCARSARSSRRRWPRAAVKLLWGTANLFSNRRYMAGAATNPDPRGLRLRRRAGEERARAHPRARRRELRALGRPRGLRDAAQHRPQARAGPARPLPQPGRRAQAQDRLQGHDPHRAQAAGADQAPVRLRRRHRLRLPQGATASRTRSRSTSSRTTRSSPATPSSTRSRSRRRSASSARST